MTQAMAMAMTDGELLELCRRGEHAAFGALVERYQAVVCAVSYSATRDQALSEDVAQETFLAAWKQLDQLREPSRLRGWLCGIARNLARKARARHDREPATDDALALAAASGNPFDAVSEAQASRVVAAALAEVPETYRDVLVLYYREQRSARDVAAALGLTEAAVMQRLARGRQHLAAGVTALVETSLQRLPRRNLAAAVLSALPVFLASRADAQPLASGASMLKIVLLTAALGAAGTTAYVAARGPSTEPSSSASSSSSPRALAPASASVRASSPSSPPAAAPRLPASSSSSSSPSLPPAPTPTAGEPCTTCDQPPPPPDDPTPLARDVIDRLGLERGPSRGPATAPVSIVVFTDMQCRFCGQSLGALDQLFDDYPNKLRVVIKQLPVKPASSMLAEAVFAADAQGKFWPLHDLMLANQDDLSPDAVLALATQAGLDIPRFRAALDAHTYAPQLASDVAAARTLSLTGTPTFFINGRRISGLMNLDTLRAAINAALGDR